MYKAFIVGVIAFLAFAVVNLVVVSYKYAHKGFETYEYNNHTYIIYKERFIHDPDCNCQYDTADFSLTKD